MNKKYFILFIFSVIFATLLSISIAVFSNTNKNNINNKIEEEIKYIDSKLLGMLNSLNNISLSNSILLQEEIRKDEKEEGQNQDSKSNTSESTSNNEDENQNDSSNQDSQKDSEKNKESAEYKVYNIENSNILLQDTNIINWTYLADAVEDLYTSWTTIMIDLNSVNINNQNILSFSNYLDELIISIQKQDKRKTLNNLALLYSLLPSYIEQTYNDLNKVNIAYTKSYIVNSYVLLEDEKWDEIEKQKQNALNSFTKVINNINNDNKSRQNINKTYVAINEMQNSIRLKDKKLFLLKYRNVMESILRI